MSSPRESPPASARFAFELLKLLLQVAWADDQVAPGEAEALLAYARKSLLSPDQIALLSECLAGRAPLPPPNLSLLKGQRVEVLRAVKELLLSDFSVAKEEEQILDQIASLLT